MYRRLRNQDVCSSYPDSTGGTPAHEPPPPGTQQLHRQGVRPWGDSTGGHRIDNMRVGQVSVPVDPGPPLPHLGSITDGPDSVAHHSKSG